MKFLFTLALLLATNQLAIQHAEAAGGDWRLYLAQDPWLRGEDAEPPSGAELQKVVTLTSDRDADVYYLHVMQNRGGGLPTGMFVEPDKKNSREDPSQKPRGKTVLLAEIESAQGASVFEAQGRKVIIVQGTLNRATHEGKLKLKYLTNGLSMTYDSCDVVLRKEGESFWVQNAYTGARINKMNIKTHFLGVVTIEGVCPAKAQPEPQS
jgi:hypothetical protein